MRTACVVGSGPSGAACAYGLLERGVEVTMIDVGLEIEPALADLTGRETPVDPGEFLRRIRRQRRLTTRAKSIPAKVPFGSDYAYRPIERTRLELEGGARLVTSLALGGLSRAWGANVCRLAARDCDDWPFPPAELDPYFRELEPLVEVAGTAGDAIDSLYGAPLAQRESYPLGAQGRMVLDRIRAHDAALRGRGLFAGRAKLAIGRLHATNGSGCVSCGLCMHGCPYNAIFSSADVVALLRRRPGFRYLGGRSVEGFRESPDAVLVRLDDLRSGASEELRFDRLFLACGVVGTTAIVARSLDLGSAAFTIRDSTKYLFPFLTEGRVPGAIAEPANTLSQVFLQATALSGTRRTVHGQLYGYNDLILDPLRRWLGDFVFRLAPLAGAVLERLMIGMVYLHSDDSGTLAFEPAPAGAGRGLGRIRGAAADRSELVAGEFLRALAAARHELGGRPIAALARRNPPGLSQHFGGSLPMARERAPRTTDVHGRPWGCARTHLVDSTVLPSIPATPTALVLMANALRIAAAARTL